MKKRNVLYITLSSLFLATGFAACRHGYHHGGFDQYDLEAATNRMASTLELDDTQKDDLPTLLHRIAKAQTSQQIEYQ